VKPWRESKTKAGTTPGWKGSSQNQKKQELRGPIEKRVGTKAPSEPDITLFFFF
jgi:hypothetical protein